MDVQERYEEIMADIEKLEKSMGMQTQINQLNSDNARLMMKLTRLYGDCVGEIITQLHRIMKAQVE